MTDLTALTAKALATSGVLWVRAGGRERLAWFAVGPADGPLAGQVLVVSGGPETELPLPGDEVEVLLRSKGDGGRLLTLRARTRRVRPADEEWGPATSALLAERLNAPADLVDRWAAESEVWALTPFGTPVQAPGRPGPDHDDRSSAPVEPAGPATPARRPWHLGDRGAVRRARRVGRATPTRPDQR